MTDTENKPKKHSKVLKERFDDRDIIMGLRGLAMDGNNIAEFQRTLKDRLDRELKGDPNPFISFFIHSKKPIIMLLVPLILLSSTFTFGYALYKKGASDFYKSEKIDDWAFKPGVDSDSLSSQVQYFQLQRNTAPSFGAPETMMLDESLGFSAGGAKDINNFRENIENGFMPLPTDITYEGLFYDYFFDTGEKDDCDELFCPSFSFAATKDPFSNKDEYYMSVGLNSNLSESDFDRKKLNLVVVLDISGSMGSPFDRYYYDRFGNYVEPGEEESKSKLEVAKESINSMLDHLNRDDRFGMVLFDDVAYLGKPLSRVGTTDMDKIKEHIHNLQPQGGTNMEAGINEGTSLFDEYIDIDHLEYENRIIFLTDAMPNTGEISEGGLLQRTQSNADNEVYTTFIGVGVDFNIELVEEILNVAGANYYSVHSSRDFSERLDDEFDYMVTPLVFDLNLRFQSEGFEIEKVYGSPQADESSGELMKVSTLFPSRSEEGETKGGMVLLKLKKLSSDGDINLKVTYKDRQGEEHVSKESVEFPTKSSEYFGNTGIRKAILLTRYVNLVRNWVYDNAVDNDIWPLGWDDSIYYPCSFEEIGICIPPEPILGQWERQSQELRVSEEYKELFEDFRNYFEDEAEEISDESLEREVDVLEKLIN